MSTEALQLYEDDLVQEENENLPVKWYAQAALASGQDTKEFETAEQYRMAAIDGDYCACYVLGMLYYNGSSEVEQNYLKAAMWFGRTHNNPFAVYQMAEMCENGIGVDQDKNSSAKLYKEALRGFLKLCEICHSPEVEKRVAQMYEKGQGTAANKNTAQYWFSMARDGHADMGPEDVVPLMPEETDIHTVSEPISDIDNSIEMPAMKQKKKGLSFPKLLHGKNKKPNAKKNKVNPKQVEVRDSLQNFLDMITPSVLDFSHPDYFVCGNTYRSVWAIREYSTVTSDLAILKEFGETDGITLHIYLRPISVGDQREIFKRSERKNRSAFNNAANMMESENAVGNIEDMKNIIKIVQREKEILVHCAVFIESIALSLDGLHELQDKVRSLCANRFTLDSLYLLQKEGFQAAMPIGRNTFRSQYERVLPSASVANFFPFSYSGKTDKHGMYIGIDVHGTNIMPDFDLRTPDKTNGNITILGNPGQGKSHLMKIIITNFRQMRKKLYSLDPENEYGTLTRNLGGCNIDMMSGQYFINVLEPRLVTDNPVSNDEKDNMIPMAFRKTTRLSQHIAYLRDFFGCYKPFSMEQLDTLEIMLQKLYDSFKITNSTDFTKLLPESYPILSDLFTLLQNELNNYDDKGNQLYTKDTLRSLTLGLQSICVGSESNFFNGHTNITNADHINFVVKGMLETNESLKNAMFLNIFSFLNHKFLTEGKAVVSLDELYLFFTNPIAIKYVLSFEKRGRKKDSNIILASQNIEDFNRPNIREFTKPLLSIPSHSFIFHLGSNCNEDEIKPFLSLSDSEFELIRNPRQGYCLYKSGSERYHLQVKCPDYKSKLFGTEGGK